MKDGQLFRVYEHPHTRGVCKGCGAALEWYETLKGKQMPVNAGSVPVKSEKDPDTWRVIVFFGQDDAHWGSCTASRQFKRHP